VELYLIPLPEETTRCGYFEHLEYTSEHFFAYEAGEEQLEILLDRGFRHFGPYFFRPVCKECSRCIPIRIPVRQYKITKSMRRLLNKNDNLREIIGGPVPTEEAFALYTLHKQRFSDGWTESYDSFVESFFSETAGARQFSMYLDGKLVGVNHFDETERVISAVYTYYTDTHSSRSLGSYAIARLLQLAAERGKKYVYLGYYIEENRHMRYKARFYPNEMSTSDGKWIPLMNMSNKCENYDAVKRGFIPSSRLF